MLKEKSPKPVLEKSETEKEENEKRKFMEDVSSLQGRKEKILSRLSKEDRDRLQEIEDKLGKLYEEQNRKRALKETKDALKGMGWEDK